MRNALEVVLGAAESKPPVNPAANAFIAQLDVESAARVELSNGKDPKQLYLALLLDADGTVSSAERPVLSGSISAIQADGKGLKLEARFDADATQLMRLEISLSATVERRWLQGLFGRRDAELGDTRGVHVKLERNPSAPVSPTARLWIVQLWALIGESVAQPGGALPADGGAGGFIASSASLKSASTSSQTYWTWLLAGSSAAAASAARPCRRTCTGATCSCAR